MTLNLPTPAEISSRNVARMKANNPFYHQKRFEIQLHTGLVRQNIYLPTWQLVEMVLRNKVKAEDHKRPDSVVVCDNRDTCIQVLKWEKSWYGYKTTLCRGAIAGRTG